MAFEGLPVIALIPARAGSKGIANKNIIDLNGKPLIQYSIEAGLNNDVIDRVVVSSDSKAILNTSSLLGAETIERPGELSGDTANVNDAINHAINTLQIDEAYIIILQATSPLRTSKHINEAFMTLKNRGARGIVSVFEPSHHPYKSYLLEDGYLTPLLGEAHSHQNRQALPKVYQPNGAIYIFTVSDFKQHQSIPKRHIAPYLMTEDTSTDIDTPTDLEKLQRRLQQEGV